MEYIDDNDDAVSVSSAHTKQSFVSLNPSHPASIIGGDHGVKRAAWDVYTSYLKVSMTSIIFSRKFSQFRMANVLLWLEKF